MPVSKRDGIAGVTDDCDRLTGDDSLAWVNQSLGDVAVVDVLAGQRAAGCFYDRVVGTKPGRIACDGADDARRDRVDKRAVGRGLDVDAIVGAPEPLHELRI